MVLNNRGDRLVAENGPCRIVIKCNCLFVSSDSPEGVCTIPMALFLMDGKVSMGEYPAARKRTAYVIVHDRENDDERGAIRITVSGENGNGGLPNE